MIPRAVYTASIPVAAGWVVAVVVLAMVTPGPSGVLWGPGQSRSFDLSASFPTGNAAYNGQLDCGPNVTESVTFPAPGIMNYTMAENESGAGVNIWIVSGGGYTFLGGGQGVGQGSIGYVDGIFHFGFIACGPTPSVPLGFWGTVTYWSGGA